MAYQNSAASDSGSEFGSVDINRLALNTVLDYALDARDAMVQFSLLSLSFGMQVIYFDD